MADIIVRRLCGRELRHRGNCDLRLKLANGTDAGSIAAPGCDNDWSTWWIGSRTQWNVTKDFYMGLDVMYSNCKARGCNGNTFATRPCYDFSDVDNWQFRFRVHRDFYP